MDDFRNSILMRYEMIQDAIGKSAILSDRKPESIKLLTVTKGHPYSVIHAAYSLGLRDFGENYIEEAVEKIEYFKKLGDIHWHMIGHLQSRKARQVCDHFSWFGALDRMKIAERLSSYCLEIQSNLPVLLECNVSGETSKFGWPAWDEITWDHLVSEFSILVKLPGIQVKGLMTMAPYLENPESTRPYFSRLRKLREYLSQNIPDVDWAELSMGMSADYPIAIEEGATIVRIGTALLGSRA
jgi:PLP dependent protein